MVDEKKQAKKEKSNDPVETESSELLILTSKQEIADSLKMSLYQFEELLKRYPFINTGISGKIRGRWRITREDALRWFRYVQHQETRHPEARRMRPEEPPEISEIHGR